MNSGPALLSGLAAIGYTLAAIVVKQATVRGATVWQVTLITHILMGLLTLPILFFQDISNLQAGDLLWPAAAGGCALFAGVLVVLALSRGDVSVATPILGCKVIIVAILVVLLGNTALSIDLWIAALLAAIGVALVAGGKVERGLRRRHVMTALYSIFGSGLFALTDVILQVHAATIGFWIFFPIMASTMAILTVLGVAALRIDQYHSLPRTARLPLFAGSLLMSLQALSMASSIGIFQAATAANVVYSSRTFLSVLAIWTIGKYFGLDEMAGRPDHLLRRLCGAFLLFISILFVLF